MSFSDKNMQWLLKIARLKCRAAKEWRAFIGAPKEVYVWSRIPFYKQIWEEAALALSAQFVELAEGIWEIRYESRATRISNHVVQLDDPVILNIAANKPLCHAALAASGLPVPAHLTFRLDEFDKVKRFVEEGPGFFVVKPAIGTSAGMGVTTHIQSVPECRKAVALASLYCDTLIIEQLIPGESYRILVLDDTVIHASRRSGLRVRGDGHSTIRRLVEQNSTWYLEMKGQASSRALEGDRDLTATLAAQGLSRESIPQAGQEILVKSIGRPLKRTDEVRTVYSENVTNLLCRDIRDLALRAARSIGSQFAGVDVITLDPTVPLEANGGVITEINTTPGLQHHYNLLNGDGMAPAVDVLKYLLGIPDGRERALQGSSSGQVPPI